MVKINKMVSLDDDVVAKAKEKGLNVSAEANEALRKRVNMVSVDLPEDDKCEFCLVKGEKETRHTIGTSPSGLSWLCPDEMWICNKCLKNKFTAHL